jgi:[Skp1-protein]-hydroxyproline N-acetylglucosaminyltransferase
MGIDGNEMAVLTTYLTDLVDSIDPVTHQSLRRDSRNMMCNFAYEGHGNQAHLILTRPYTDHPHISGTPMLHPYWSAGFSFARGHFVVQVPYDQYLPIVFQGEESSITVRAFTYGYDFYAPEYSVAFHMFAIKENVGRRSRHKYWENGALYTGSLEKSLLRLNGIIGASTSSSSSTTTASSSTTTESTSQGKGTFDFFQKDMHKYGLGAIRDKKEYYRRFGIHTDTLLVEDHLCDFVQESMHRSFAPCLRDDGMGIDYSCVPVFDF